jgi:hypothetical protein
VEQEMHLSADARTGQGNFRRCARGHLAWIREDVEQLCCRANCLIPSDRYY